MDTMISLLASALLSQSFAKVLLHASVLHRHGIRTPCTEWPGDQSNAKFANVEPGLGQLTPAGATEVKRVGAQLRQRYVATHGLLSGNYVSSEWYSRSTHVDRTLQSANALLQGVYPWPASGGSATTVGSLRPVLIYFSVNFMTLFSTYLIIN